MSRRKLSFECLEQRTLMDGDGVEVTPTQVITHHDVIPRFAIDPDFIAIASGRWTDPSTWNLIECQTPMPRF